MVDQKEGSVVQPCEYQDGLEEGGRIQRQRDVGWLGQWQQGTPGEPAMISFLIPETEWQSFKDGKGAGGKLRGLRSRPKHSS